MRLLLFFLLLAGLAIPALARSDSPPDRSGHYYLQGVMETGSELLLRPDGSFQWYLSVGALDLVAEGGWSEQNGAVVLMAEKTKDVPEPAFETMRLTIRDADLIPPNDRGAYVKAPPSSD
ncbi:hypothetical protein MOK15_08300 [Sphingobium sp. BYY-5]|uniref:hypothetical protein n=1 Tax=Sphingobium sp. BYY-5 TaxID=2926400 RepID=UPI001FA6F7B3|nr:hypothetical protein [Sphingobium sp. BYY-5]MCI4590094.1 hypothetical protein [Sphingobium sp. BYY-5]